MIFSDDDKQAICREVERKMGLKATVVYRPAMDQPLLVTIYFDRTTAPRWASVSVGNRLSLSKIADDACVAFRHLLRDKPLPP